MPTTSHTINRLLSRREKDGSDHRRQKSRDKSTDSKVRCMAVSRSFIFSPISQKRPLESQSVVSISVAFRGPYGKSAPCLQTTYSTIHTHSADSRPGFILQTRPVSAEILSMLKSDPLKNIDKEQALKV